MRCPAFYRGRTPNDVPVTPWGAGTSTEGNPVPTRGGLVVDLTLMNRILDIRPQDLQADVEPGVLRKELNRQAGKHGLFFPPDPGADATIGGMIANNASGVQTVKYGATKDYVMRLTVVLPQGGIIHTGCKAPKSSSGYDLTRLFVGSEGTPGNRHRGNASPDRHSQSFSGRNHPIQGSGKRIPGRGPHDRIGPGTRGPGAAAARA